MAAGRCECCITDQLCNKLVSGRTYLSSLTAQKTCLAERTLSPSTLERQLMDRKKFELQHSLGAALALCQQLAGITKLMVHLCSDVL